MKRAVRLVAEEPARRNGKARLHAYGIRAVANVAGVSTKTVRRANVNLASLRAVTGFILERNANSLPVLPTTPGA